MRRLFLLALLCAGLSGGARAAEPADPIRAGYELFYRGDLRGAYDHFRALAERDPDNLAAAYGALSAVYVRDQAEEALEAEFDERADALLRRAAARLGWIGRRTVGKALSLPRLAKGLFTFAGGPEYIAWKIERHSGVAVNLSPRARRYPLLAGWVVVWRLYRRGAFR